MTPLGSPETDRVTGVEKPPTEPMETVVEPWPFRLTVMVLGETPSVKSGSGLTTSVTGIARVTAPDVPLIVSG